MLARRYGTILRCGTRVGTSLSARQAHHASVRLSILSPSLPTTLLPGIRSRPTNRDLKPDNILLDESGHAHITDFNIAVHYTDKRLLTGVAGSMAYMAPEILAKRGYTYPIDWWSLGVCAYELVFGRRPFRGRTNSALTHSIGKDPLRFPEGAEEKCSKAGMQFLKWVSSVVYFLLTSFSFSFVRASPSRPSRLGAVLGGINVASPGGDKCKTGNHSCIFSRCHVRRPAAPLSLFVHVLSLGAY